jgi:hypothetical protein
MKRIIGYLLTALVFSSCVKEESSDGFFVAYPNADTVWQTSLTGRPVNTIDTLFTPPDAAAVSVATASNDTAHFGSNIAVRTTPGFCLQPNGNPVQGSVKIELLQFDRKGDFIRYGKQTTSGDKILDKQTIFRVKVTQYYEPMILNSQAMVTIRYRTTLMSGHVSVFTGDTLINDPTNFSWEETTDAARPFDGVENGNVILGYDIPCSKLGWISFGKLIDNSTGAKLTVVQPVTCTNNNTAVYAVFKNQRTVLRLLPDLTSRTFFVNHLPAGSDLLLVSISKIGSALYLGTSSLVTGTNSSVVKMKTEAATKQQISDFLDGL